MRNLLFLLLFFTSQLLAQYADSVFTDIEQMPCFSGCSAFLAGTEEQRNCSDQAAKAFISNQIIYPREAKEAGVEGVVYVSFVIDQNGEVKDIHLLNDIGAGCGQEAMRVLKSMPKWEPGVHEEDKVKVRLNLPVHFYFKDDKEDLAYGYTLVWGNLKDSEVSRKALRKNLNRSPMLFDPKGKEVILNELIFSYKKNNKIRTESSTGKITDTMKRLVKKIKKGSHFSIVAILQKDGKFIEVNKAFLVLR